MTIPRWLPPTKTSTQEKFLIKRLGRTRKLFAFLRTHRRELFDDAFQDELAGMYRDTGAGRVAVSPAIMAMALLLQGYVGASDAEAVELTVVDLRWQLVLGRLGETTPAFSQGALQNFRERLIAANLDRRLLERTVELAGRTKEFDPKKLPKTLRIAIDSSPLEGAGRVEDTFNLLGHAARKVAECAAALLDMEFEQLCKKAGIRVLLSTSVKKALDCDWSEPIAKDAALDVLVAQLESMQSWLSKQPELQTDVELRDRLATLKQIMGQDLEPDPNAPKGKNGKDRMRIRKGTAPDRRVSIEDADMRHGRKSKSRAFNGFKRHIAADLDTSLIIACAVTPANRPEEEATEPLQRDLECQQREVGELYIDRGYINATLVDAVAQHGGVIVCKPWRRLNARPELFGKRDFHIDPRRRLITCPQGQTERFEPGTTVEFDAQVCAVCPVRSRCTMASLEHGRTVSIGHNEALQKELRKLMLSPYGREQFRQRVPVEHKLAHIGQRQGRRARYRGLRRNLYDLRRAASLQNLETVHRVAPIRAAA